MLGHILMKCDVIPHTAWWILWNADHPTNVWPVPEEILPSQRPQMRIFLHTSASVPTIRSTLHHKPVAALYPHNRELHTDSTAPRWEALTGPEMEGFALFLHEELLFFDMEGRFGDSV